MALNRADFYDAELRRYNERFRAAVNARPGERVLDIGCGAGQSTREAARAAAPGEALGVDISEALLDVARRRSAEEGLHNVAFERADAQTHSFQPGYFHLCISRFGAMFFADPIAAFANINRAMRPGARLVLLVWQAWDRNEWATAIHDALAPGSDPPSGAPAFSLADPSATSSILTRTGFTAIAFEDVRETVFYGAGVDAAYQSAVELFMTKDALASADAADAGHAFERLRTLLNAHLTAESVFFDSRAWIVTARNAGTL